MSIFNWKRKTENKVKAELISNESQMLFARFLFDTEPAFDDALIEIQLSKYFKNFNCSKGDSKDSARQYFFNDFPVEYQEGTIPAQCTIFKPQTFDHIENNLELAYRQIWHWSDAKNVTQNCQYEIVLNDLMTRPLNYKLRVDLFQKFVRSIASALKPKAVYFPTSEKIVEPTEYVDEILTPGGDILYGLLNVRLFNIKESDELLMDTLGLHGLGLPDFQMKFSGYDPGQIAGLLRSYAHYIFQYGSVIENGNTVEGLETGSKWSCYYKTSLMGPVRNIIEIQG